MQANEKVIKQQINLHLSYYVDVVSYISVNNGFTIYCGIRRGGLNSNDNIALKRIPI